MIKLSSVTGLPMSYAGDKGAISNWTTKCLFMPIEKKLVLIAKDTISEQCHIIDLKKLSTFLKKLSKLNKT